MSSSEPVQGQPTLQGPAQSLAPLPAQPTRFQRVLALFKRRKTTKPQTKLPPTLHAGHLEIYSAFRDYVKHEDDLTNNRLNWNLTMQGFLFAAYSFSIQKIADQKAALLTAKTPTPAQVSRHIDIDLSIDALQHGIVIICGVGLAVSVFVFLGALGAQIATSHLRCKWRDEHDEGCLPRVVGGGSTPAYILGAVAPLCIPLVLTLAWLLLFFYRPA
jgi:hypothetical protein